jgi:uracil-DNA glycosylase
VERDVLGFARPDHGCLEAWARRGVLLLNTILTVREGKALSHKGQGWEEVTDAILRAVNAKSDRVVFLLWGGKAKRKRKLVTGRQHKVLTSNHPASRREWLREFLDCGHFSKANRLLSESGRDEVDWSLSVPPRSRPRRP